MGNDTPKVPEFEILKVTPATTELKAGESQAFEVRNQDNKSVGGIRWSLVDPRNGFVDESGVYRAPATVRSSSRATIVAEQVGTDGRILGRGTAVVNVDPIRYWLLILGSYWAAVLIALLTALGFFWGWLCPNCSPPELVVNPPLVTLGKGRAQQFTASSDATFSNTTTPAGLFVAPASIDTDQAITVTATSAAEPRRSGSALVRLSPAGSLSLHPNRATVRPGEEVELLADLAGDDVKEVEWLKPATGTGEKGVFKAPADARPGRLTLFARAAASGSPSHFLLAAATVTVVPRDADAGFCECAGDRLGPWRLVMLVALMGALGGVVHGVGSFGTYVGNRELRTSWLWWYFLKPVLGGIVAVEVFLVFRAGLGMPDLGVSSWDCLKVAGLAGLMGLFAEPATLKLRDVFEAVFTPRRDPRTDKAGETRPSASRPVITKIDPEEVDATKGGKLRIVGNGFSNDCVVEIGPRHPTIESRSTTELTAVIDPRQLEAGAVEVVVRNNPPSGEGSAGYRITVK